MTGHQLRLIGALVILVGVFVAVAVNNAVHGGTGAASSPPAALSTATPFADDFSAQLAAAQQLAALPSDATTTSAGSPLVGQLQGLLGQLAAVCPSDSYSALESAVASAFTEEAALGRSLSGHLVGLLTNLLASSKVTSAGQVGSCQLAIIHYPANP